VKVFEERAKKKGFVRCLAFGECKFFNAIKQSDGSFLEKERSMGYGIEENVFFWCDG